MCAAAGRAAPDQCPDEAAAEALLEEARALVGSTNRINGVDRARVSAAIERATVACSYFRAAASPRGLHRSLTLLSWLHWLNGDLIKAVRFGRRALRYVRHAEDPEAAALHLHHNLAIYYQRLQDFGRAEDALRHLLVAAKRKGDQKLAAVAYFGLSRVYQSQGRNEEALSAAFRALRRYRRLGEQTLVAGLRNNIGMLLAERGEYRRAAEQLQQALRLARGIGAVAIEANVLTELARLSLRTGDVASAERYARQALRLTLEVLREEIRLARLYVVYAGIFEARGEIERAAHYIDEAVELFELHKSAVPDAVEFAAACALQERLRQKMRKGGTN